MEKISIENFAGIKSMEFEFKSINILIGPQGSGKSISVKLLYYFKSFFSEIIRSIESEETKRELDIKQKDKFTTFFPKESWPDGDFRITYQLDDTLMFLERTENRLNFEYSENLRNAISQGRKIYVDEKKKIGLDPTRYSFLQERELSDKIEKYIASKTSDIIRYRQFFIPAGRSFFANIQKSIFSFLSDNRSLDPFLIEFGSYYDSFKRFYRDEAFGKLDDKRFDEIVSGILNSNYLREKDKDYLVHEDNRKVNLSNASSGQQETLPLVVILRTLNMLNFSDGGSTIYIEEPEAHLFPTAQKSIVQLLARTFNHKKNKFQIIVTTHSPYILSAFNNLLEAGRLKEIRPDQAKNIAKIVPKEEQIGNDLITAYSLNRGKKKDLIDEETNLISPTILDGVSNEIAIEFGKLLDIEF